MKIPKLSRKEAEGFVKEIINSKDVSGVNYTDMYRAGYNHARKLAKKAKLEGADKIIMESELFERIRKLEEFLRVLRDAVEGTRLTNRDGIKALNDKYAYMMTKLREMEKLLMPESIKKEDICL